MAGGASGRLKLAPDLGASVGSRLRAQRRALGQTLSETARAAGISTSYLSSIEIGNSVPSLPILARVVEVLDLSLNEVLRNVGHTVVATGRLDAEAPGIQVVSHEDLLLEVAFLVSEAGRSGECPVPTAAQEVFVYLLEGGLEAVVDGEAYQLGAGDSLDVESPGQLSFRAGPDGAVSIWAAIDSHSSRGPGVRGAR